MNTVLVLGANGRFGQAAVQAFAHAGWRVLAQMRRAPAQALPPDAETLLVPLEDTTGLAWDSGGARVVVYAVNPPYTQWRTQALSLFRQGLAVAQRLGAHFMLPGNVYNFGDHLPALLQEDTPQHANHEKARIRIEMEAELQQAAATGVVKATVIRAGDFYGCGSGSWLDLAIAKDLRKGRLVYPGPLDVPHAWAYLPDLAAAFVAVASLPTNLNPSTSTPTSNLTPTPTPTPTALQNLHFAGHTLTGRQLLQAVDEAAASLGLRPAQGFAVSGMPWGVIRTLGLVVPMWRELARMRYLWTAPHTLDGRLLARTVGPLPDTPVVLALRQALLDLGLAPEQTAAPTSPQTAAQTAAPTAAQTASDAKALSSQRAPA